jgi:hypothetical protein
MSAPSGHVSRTFERHEDELLIELVKKYGTDSWNSIAASLGNRTARQCRNRYTLFLASGINSAAWTPEEDDLLKEQYERVGPKWAILRQFFPGRTDLNIKNRFVFLARNSPEVRYMRARYATEHGGDNCCQSDGGSSRPKKKHPADEGGCAVPVTFDALFQSLPYYMKRCLLLENILESHQMPAPPHGVCDDWIDAAGPGEDVEQVAVDGDQLPIHQPDDGDKQ